MPSMRRFLPAFLLSVLLSVAPASAQPGRGTALPEFHGFRLLSALFDAWSALQSLVGEALTTPKSQTDPAADTGPTDGGTTQEGTEGSTSSGSGTDPNGPGIDPNG